MSSMFKHRLGEKERGSAKTCGNQDAMCRACSKSPRRKKGSKSARTCLVRNGLLSGWRGESLQRWHNSTRLRRYCCNQRIQDLKEWASVWVSEWISERAWKSERVCKWESELECASEWASNCVYVRVHACTMCVCVCVCARAHAYVHVWVCACRRACLRNLCISTY